VFPFRLPFLTFCWLLLDPCSKCACATSAIMKLFFL
jgi:hypothetical protein